MLVDVLPAQREQLAASKTREDRQPDHRPREQRQGSHQRGCLPRRQGPLRTDASERRHIDAPRRVLLEVAPFHGRAKNRAQHIVNVIDGLGRVPDLREMGHVRLDLLSRHIRDRHVAELRQQVLLQHEPTMLLGRVLVHRQNRSVPFAGQRPERDARSRRRPCLSPAAVIR